jgi:hypothetical protein
MDAAWVVGRRQSAVCKVALRYLDVTDESSKRRGMKFI